MYYVLYNISKSYIIFPANPLKYISNGNSSSSSIKKSRERNFQSLAKSTCRQHNKKICCTAIQYFILWFINGTLVVDVFLILVFQALLFLYISLYLYQEQKKIVRRKLLQKETHWKRKLVYIVGKISSAVPSATVKNCFWFFFLPYFRYNLLPGIFFFIIKKKQEVLKISTRRPFFQCSDTLLVFFLVLCCYLCIFIAGVS